MNTDDISRIVEDEFVSVYSHFKEFQTDQQFQNMWKLCMDTVNDRDSMLNIVFCNDMYQIPPVKVFIDINRQELESLKSDKGLFDDKGCLKTYVKQSLGAFWGMVFRYGLGYDDRNVSTVVASKYYGVRTASHFIHVQKD